MKNIFIGFFALIVFFSANLYSQTAPEKDFQFWFDTQISFPLIKTKDKNDKEIERLSFFVTGVLRGGRNLSHFIDERAGAGFDIYVNKYVSLSPSYLYRAGQPFAGKKEYEHRLRFDASIEKKWSSFSIRDRNRVEYRIRNSRPDSVRYRNRIQLRIPVKRNAAEIFTPFVSTEPFYDFSEKAWTRNEFSAGISRRFAPNASADFFYMLQTNRGNAFKTVNIIGASLKFKVD
jgi:hypothetical protein